MNPAAGPATPALERFARETLGCQCEPAVFQQVVEDWTTLPGLPTPVRCIAIGGRLLIYLIPVPDPRAALGLIADWAAAALAERERRDMNRVRLVLGHAQATPAQTQAIATAFAQAPARDERLHLHQLPTAALAALDATDPNAAA